MLSAPQLLEREQEENEMNWLPKHKCGLYLEHNAHKDVYEIVREYYKQTDFVSDDEYFKAIADNNVWCLQWYPETPVSFYRIAASSLEAIQEAVKEFDE